jgi:hypothetical protein
MEFDLFQVITDPHFWHPCWLRAAMIIKSLTCFWSALLLSPKILTTTRISHMMYISKLVFLATHEIFQKFHIEATTVKPPFNVPWFQISLNLMCNFSDPISVTSVLNYLHSIFSSVRYSNSLITKETQNGGFTVPHNPFWWRKHQ